MSNVKHAAAISHLRFVCSLGLRSELLAPAIVDAMHAILGFSNIGFQWISADGELAKIWFDQELGALIFREAGDPFVRARTMTRMMNLHGARLVAEWGEEFDAGDYYDTIWKPLQFHIGIIGIVRTPSDDIGRSVISVYRTAHDPPFLQVDADLLAQTIPYLALAFGAGEEQAGTFVDTGREGLLVADRNGSIHIATRSAIDLLFYGSGANLVDCPHSPRCMATELVRRIVCRFESPSVPAPPPMFHVDNPFGRFTFRAARCDGHPDLIGMTVRRQEPLLLRLARESRHLPLSPTQKHILVYAAQQKSNADIASRLHIRPDTVKGHMARIMDRLGIHGRHEIADSVLRHAHCSTPLDTPAHDQLCAEPAGRQAAAVLAAKSA